MSTTPANKNMGLQAVRGGAALLVLFQHVFWLAGYFASGPTHLINSMLLGGVGVFLFFGLSGYLMGGQMSRPPKRFIMDRVRRIYPGLLLAFLVSGLSLSCFSYRAWPEWTTILLLPMGQADSIYIPYWTLIYEMQFYILIVIIGQIPKKYRTLVLLGWGAAIVGFHAIPPSLVASASYPGPTEILFSFYNLYFIAGVLALHSRNLLPCRSGELLVAFFSLVVGVLANIFIQRGVEIYYNLLLITVFFAIRGASEWAPKGGGSNLIVRLGDVSYGVYLIHITTCFLVVLFVKEVLRVELSYWQGVSVIFLVGGGAAYFFGVLELRLQEKLKVFTATSPSILSLSRSQRE